MSTLPFYECDNIELYPCGKCKRECLTETDCINCSTCGTWYHFMCTNMTEDEFKNVHYVFCNKKCENKLSIPANFTSITLTRNRKSVSANHKSNNDGKDNAPAKKNSLKAFPNKSVLHHYCDISCSYEEPSLINNTH